MSCISEVLKIKGNKEFMPFPESTGLVIEGGGEHKGYEYLITFTEMGHRCGYVAINPDHPCYKKDLVSNGDFDVSVHGGVTFHREEHAIKKMLKHPCSDEWIGFDAAHYNDRACIRTAEKYFGSENTFIKHAKTSDFYMKPDFFGDIVIHRTFEYMEQECKNLIDQLIEIKNDSILQNNIQGCVV